MKNIRYYVFWILDFLKGSPMRKNYQEIKRLIESGNYYDWQKDKLAFLIKEASDNCKFYETYAGKDITQCPVIDKSVIKENYENILSKKYDRSKLHMMSTSGSTGTPFEVLENREKRIRMLSEFIYFNEIIGQNVGDKFVFYRVWTEKNKKSKLGQIKQNLIPVDILKLDDNNLCKMIQQLRSDKKINSTLAYASTYNMMLKYMEDNNISGGFNVKSMVSSSEILEEKTRSGLEERMGCKVIDRYSNQECGILAQSNLKSNRLMVNYASYYFEILKVDSDMPAETGEVGRVVITDLFNYSMPLIRYDTGDVASLMYDENGKPYIQNIGGRRVDIIYDTKGNPLTSHTWGVYMWKFDKLKQYQFIQEGQKDYVLKVNGAKGIYTDNDFVDLIKNILGEDANVEIQHVDNIPVLSSGKFKKTICNYKPL